MLLARALAGVAGWGVAGGLVACAANKEDARQLAINWFVAELKRVGYADKGDGVYGTAPKPVSGLLSGDALEAQIRGVQVTSVRETVVGEQDKQRDVTWRGQVFLAYELREQYHQNGQPKGWSEWQKQTSILSLEKRANQWYISRVQ